MNYQNRIKCLRKLDHLSQEQFAKKYNVAQTAVSNWEKQRNNIDIGTASKIAEDYTVPVEFIYGFPFEVRRPMDQWFDDEREDMLNAPSECRDFFMFRFGNGIFPNTYHEPKSTKNPPIGVKIPILGSVAAGIPIEAITDIEDYEEIPKEMANSGDFVALRIKGNSMAPKIENGDIVIIRTQNTIEDGEIAIVIANGDEATCKKIKKTPEGIILVPNNPDYEPHFYSNKEIEQLPVRIFGKVVELRRTIQF